MYGSRPFILKADHWRGLAKISLTVPWERFNTASPKQRWCLWWSAGWGRPYRRHADQCCWTRAVLVLVNSSVPCRSSLETKRQGWIRWCFPAECYLAEWFSAAHREGSVICSSESVDWQFSVLSHGISTSMFHSTSRRADSRSGWWTDDHPSETRPKWHSMPETPSWKVFEVVACARWDRRETDACGERVLDLSESAVPTVSVEREYH